MIKNEKISSIDKRNYQRIKNNISRFLEKAGKKYDKKGILLDIAPQIHEGAAPYFKKLRIETLDIDPTQKSTYTADICENNKLLIPDGRFDIVICTEVLEHVLNPFSAVKEIFRILKSNGLVFITTPFNFRIHGPLPDCWRFTEHGLRVLLKDFKILNLTQIPTRDRWLMPIHYSVVARK